MILSTCNRTELYWRRRAGRYCPLAGRLPQDSRSTLEPYLYRYQTEALVQGYGLNSR
ncbi:hypothetical protein [Eikenella exigua]|uniref:hypothetical protein n=1 Tax=Eikenella TaxID=538 RepID=UPI001878A11E